jgi:transposase
MKLAEAPVPRDQINLIPTSLDELIHPDSPIRLIDELLDHLDWTVFNENYRYEKRGRPPIPPRILAAVWIWAFFRRVRSSRNLEYQLNNNIEFMWLAHGHRIDHSTLAAFRKHNRSPLKKVHANLVRLAKELGIIKIAELYIDATRIKANANRGRVMTAAKASKLLEIVDQQIEAYLEGTESADQADDLLDDATQGEHLPEMLADLHRRKEQIEQMAQTCREMDAIRKKQGIDPEKNPFQLPITDPDSRVLPNKEGGYAPNYTPLIAVESELGMIVSTTIFNGTNEQDYLIGIVDEVESSYSVTVETVGADAAYSTGANIAELEFERQKDFVSPHRNGDPAVDNPAKREDPTEPVSEKDAKRLPTTSQGTFSIEAFVYDAENDQVHCPAGKTMPRSYVEKTTQNGGRKVERTIYQSPSCEGCAFLAKCRGNGGPFKSGRRVMRDEYEDRRSEHREKMSTPEAKERYGRRFSPGERPFGQIKEHFGMRRFQTRGQPSVESEFSLAAIAQGIQRMANFIAGRLDLRAKLNKNV